MSLTHKQKAFLEYIQHFIDTHQTAPSYADLQLHFGFASKSSVYRHLKTLKNKGFIQIHKNRMDMISLVQKSKKSLQTYSLPLLGLLNDEGEIEALEQEENILCSFSKKIPRNCYALKVKSGNYLEAGLLHHDLILIEPRSEAKVGETILACVYSEKHLIKKYQPKGPYIRLDSFCVQIEPMIVSPEELVIQGILLGVIRTFG